MIRNWFEMNHMDDPTAAEVFSGGLHRSAPGRQGQRRFAALRSCVWSQFDQLLSVKDAVYIYILHIYIYITYIYIYYLYIQTCIIYIYKLFLLL